MASTSNLFIDGASDDLVQSISLGNPKVNSSGGKNIPVFNKLARSGLKVTTPEMLTWGVNENDFDGTGKKSYDMSLQFPSPEYVSEETDKFLDNLTKMEDFIKAEALTNSKLWFGKAHSAEVLDAFWTPLLRRPKNKDTGDLDLTKSPSLRVKIPFWDGQFKTEVYNTSGELIFPKSEMSILDVIPKGSRVKMILNCGGIWFAGGKFGITWKPYQIIVKPKFQLVSGVCHIKMADVKEPQVETTNQEQTLQIESDDEQETTNPEQEYLDQPQDQPEVPVKGKRKVIKRAS
jgi:hypothetical protein